MPELVGTALQPGPGLRVNASLIGKLNLADYQNAVPALRELVVFNETDALRERLVVSASSDPGFFKPRTWHIDSIGPQQSCHISSLDLHLDGPLLSRLNESEHATVKFEIRLAEQDETALATCEHVVELLPRNHWGGLSHVPEMVAAFVQPNDPATEKLLKKAAQLLRDSGKNPALNGYEGGSKHAWEILSAIWGALASERLDYALPPASFEQTGQKVRSPAQVLESGLGTCLDLSLLFAGAAEQSGLNPLIIFTAGHAFVGCWLRQEEFSEVVTDDPAALRKRLRLKELLLVETTVITEQPAPTFSWASERGARQLAEDAPAAFESAVDVRRARMRKIRPLAAAEALTALPREASGTDGAALTVEDAPDLPDYGRGEAIEADPRSLSPKDRVARWQRKLLDLSLRNSLLNFRKGKRAVTFEAPDPGRLEDALAGGQALRLLPLPPLMDDADPRSRAIHESRTLEDARHEHALNGLARQEVFCSPRDSKELDAALVDLYRSARASLDEGGANTLFVALGFLSWTQEGKQQKYRAPLILIPATLNRRSVRSGFTLSVHEDEPQFNPTLLEMLRQDFSLNLGIAEGELPKDESGLDVERIWAQVSEAIKDIEGWEVVPDVVLSTFSFAKHLMWKDLVHRTDQLRDNPVVKHLIDTPREGYPSEIHFVEPRTLDTDFDPRQTFCPLPSDSSQLAAVMSAARGKDFVLIGPPGTGKSQTIANLIAHSIASGRRVLFVAEKIAALEVVHRRLREVGLGQFCLEVHSSKAKKASVLGALGAAWDARGSADNGKWEEEALRLKTLRESLNLYVERLHRRRSNGMTVHGALANVIGKEDVPDINLDWPDPFAHDVARLEIFRKAVAKLETNAAAFGSEELTLSPLMPIGQTQWSPLWQAGFLRTVKEVQAKATSMLESYGRLVEITGLPLRGSLTALERSAMAELAVVLPNCAGKPWAFTAHPDAGVIIAELISARAVLLDYRSSTARLAAPWAEPLMAELRNGPALLDERQMLLAAVPAPWPRTVTDELERGIALLEEVAEQQRRLSVPYDTAGIRVPVTALLRDWQKAETSRWPFSTAAKRRVTSALTPAVIGGGEPNPGRDLPILKQIEATQAKADAIELRAVPREVWSGVGTSIGAAKAALRLQSAVASVSEGKTWKREGLEAVASGLCGPTLKKTSDTLHRLSEIDAELKRLDRLSSATDGLWAGADTNRDALLAAIDFCDDWHSGVLRRAHDAIAGGECGEYLRGQHAALQDRARLEERLADFADLAERTDGVWRGLETNLSELDGAIEFARTFGRTLPAFTDTEADDLRIRTAIERLCRLGTGAESIRQAGLEFESAAAAVTTAIRDMAESGCFAGRDRTTFETVDDAELRNRCTTIIAAAPRLQRWCSWRQAREEAETHGLVGLVSALEKATIGPADLPRVFEVNYSRWWLNHVVTADEVLRTFLSAEHEKRISEFQALDDQYTDLTRDWIRANLCAAIPAMDSVPANPEWGLLKHELTKKKRQLPLRELMERIPSVVTKLTPCLLMSPLSIAQYLAVSAASFDLVVFDEASQIPVWDAIGAIARARQVVMVGDPKQLPPTNFFNKADGEDDLDDIPEDLESILDECIGANLPSRQLSWHYRSRHESLIAFSNRRYYGGGLVTFPSPMTDDRAVSFHHVPGVYEKGGARTNPKEARAIVRDIVDRLNSRGFADAGLSIGVVTFNTDQQRLIEDMLDQERRTDPAIEQYFAEDRLEPIFVKNLESVQGDERDVMYFSITYGPDINGRVFMNFGPMNREGGERRLNVAITRARQELRVFSTLRPEQIDLSRTQARGVSELKHFLEFAEQGPRAFAELVSRSTGGFESPFEEYVAAALQTRGWNIHAQIGVSDFRIDLGVVHPDAAGIYLAGIECDGATYHRSATARDRDKLRQQVLRGLGWEIRRVWSTGWWIDQESTLNRLDTELHSILRESRAQREAAAPASPIVTDPDESCAPVAEPSVEELPAELAATATAGVGGYRSNQAQALSEHAPPHPPSASDVQADAERFFERSYEGQLGILVSSIVEAEGPILDEVLVRQVARLHGWQRTGARITDRVTRVAVRTFKKTKEDAGTFFWPNTLEAGQLAPFRSGLDRSVDEICIQELESLALDMLAGGATADEEAIAAMAKAIGLQRLRAPSRSRIEAALGRAQRRLRSQ